MIMTRWQKLQWAGMLTVAMLVTPPFVGAGLQAGPPSGVPEALTYTGQLRVDGGLWTGDTLWRFAVVTSTGGVLWTNDGSLTLPPASGVLRKAAAGRVSIPLGEKTSLTDPMQPLPSGVFAAPQTYLRAWVAAPTTAQPEELIAADQPVPHAQAFTSVPYSHRAARAGQADEAARADEAATAAVAHALAPSVAGQPVEVQGDLHVRGRIVEEGRVGATSRSPDHEAEADDDHGKRGRVTFDTVTTRHLIVTDSVSLPGGSVFTSTVTQVQTMVVVGTATVGTQLRIGTATVVIDAPGNSMTFSAPGAGTIQTEGTNALVLNPANAGNVGIGTTAPGAKLEVSQADNTDATTALRVRTGTGLFATDKFTVDGAGNATISGAGDVVGPALLLRNTTSGARWNLGLNGANANNLELTANGNPRLLINRFSGQVEIADLVVSRLGTPRVRLTDPLSGDAWEWAGVPTASGGRMGLRRATAIGTGETVTEALSVLPGGNVGVGTASPQTKLDVAGDIQSTGTVKARRLAATEGLDIPGGGVITSTVTQVQTLVVTTSATFTGPVTLRGEGLKVTDATGEDALFSGTPPNMITITPGANPATLRTAAVLQQANPAPTGGVPLTVNAGLTGPLNLNSLGTGPILMKGANAGPVGVGSTAPGARFNVVPNAAGVVGAVVQGAAGQTADLQQWQTAAGAVVATVASDGKVGIGTMSPAARLDIQQADETSATTALQVRTGATPTTKFSVDGAGNATAARTMTVGEQVNVGPKPGGTVKVRMGEITALPRNFQIRTNAALDVNQQPDDITKPSWALAMATDGLDEFSIHHRAPTLGNPTVPFLQMLRVDGVGNLISTGGLTVADPGTGGVTKVRMRMGELSDVPGDFQIRTNAALTAAGAQDDSTRPTWAVRMGPASDDFAVFRKPPGGGFAQRLGVGANGDTQVTSDLNGGGLAVGGNANPGLRLASSASAGRQWALSSKDSGQLQIDDQTRGLNAVLVRPVTYVPPAPPPPFSPPAPRDGYELICDFITARNPGTVVGHVSDIFRNASGESLPPGMVVALAPELPMGFMGRNQEIPIGNIQPATKNARSGPIGIVASKYDVPIATQAPAGLRPVPAGELAEVAIQGAFRFCFATAVNGSIRIGDALRISDTPGRVERAGGDGKEHILGVAMSDLEAGEGTIAVLVRPSW